MRAASQPVIVVAPDSFKGSISAPRAAAAIGAGLLRVWPNAEIRLRPMADGGEGTLDAVLSVGGHRLTHKVEGAGGASIDAAFGIIDDGATAVIEAAEVVGLTDAFGVAVDVESRTTRGIGQLMLHLLATGVRHFMIGLGGSSTNDGGAGLLAALGVKLHDSDHRIVAPSPQGIARIAQVDSRELDPRLGGARITIMSDVNNPLNGQRGATAIFGPQKGVRVDRIALVDASLEHFARLVEHETGRRARELPGAGAAGGLGFALQLLGGEMRSGAEVVAGLVDLDGALDGADWLITGEGRTDAQTLLGKTPWVVAQHAHEHGVPATLISGGIDRSALAQLGRHFAGCFSLPFGPATLQECIANAGPLLSDHSEQIARLFASLRPPAAD